MMSKVPVSAETLRALLAHAIKHGTVLEWCDLALEWADAATLEYEKLIDELSTCQQTLQDCQEKEGE